MNDAIKVIRLRYSAACAICAAGLEPGTQAGYERTSRRAFCVTCLPVDHERPTNPGTAGASLDREYERRRQVREAGIRARFPRLGGLVLALSDDPASTKAFARGADGERRLAARLEKLCGDDVLFLHNRRRGRSSRSGDIDHIAVAPSGIYVIDAKHYKGATVNVRRTGGVLRPVREQLMVRGRDKTHLVESLNKQYVAVVEAVRENPVPVTALFCFVDAVFPLLERLTVAGLPVLGPRGTIKLLRRRGPLDAEARRWLWEDLARRLPSA